jgi:outer membrane protein assembly factor BamA
MVGLDSRPSAGYARRGGFYGVTFHDYTDTGGAYGFTQLEYEAVQHLPVLRESWVISLHGRVATTGTKTDEVIPFFLLPAVGGGSSLRGFSSWRFRDRNSLELQAEWRVIVNRFIDMAVFFDAGKVTADTRDLNLDSLKTDAGLGFRFHGPIATPLRIEVAQGNEGLSFIFAASAAF